MPYKPAFSPVTRFLMVQQFAINVSCLMLLPYLAAHLAHDVGLAAWAVALVLGLRNLSQQGMFLVGGTLADRVGYKPVMMAGCLLRTVGFTALGFGGSLPVLLAASAATGFAGALFNPAVRAYLARSAGDQRVAAFARFNAYYQAGSFIGPLAGLALLAADFQVVCVIAAGVFAVLTLVQAWLLPPGGRPATNAERPRVLADWRAVVADKRLPLFAAAMAGSYVLSFQVYLIYPLAAAQLAPGQGDVVTTALFAVSALVAALGQTRIAGWAGRRWSAAGSIVVGLAVMSGAFVVPAVADGVPGLFLSVVLLAVGGAAVYPFEMDTIVGLAEPRLVATFYGLYSTVAGVGITLGNLAIGALWGWSARLSWAALAAVGLAGTLGVAALARAGRLKQRTRTGKAADTLDELCQT